MKRIYLDYNASTPVAPEVVEAIRPFFTEHYGNPSTQHWAGKPAKEAIEQARVKVAALLGCKTSEVVFTSGGSESNNHAIKGAYFALKEKGNHIITTQIEHPAVIHPCRFLERLGARVTYVGVDASGKVSVEEIERAITDQTILISVMHANNEVGTIQPISEISRLARKYGILLHTDAAQSAGKIPTFVEELGVDLLSLAGHKMYAPKGIGALYIREGTNIEPFVHGAGHESGRRAGTENLWLIVALGQASELVLKDLSRSQLTLLRDYFWSELKQYFGEKVVLNGHPSDRLPNTCSISFLGQSGSEIASRIPEVAVSTGSACHTGRTELSPVLRAMDVSEEVGKGTIRFSLGRYTTKEEIDRTLYLLKEHVPL